MPISVSERENLWDDFLTRWPANSLHKLRLENYTSVGDVDTFCYWVERKTYQIGSIQGNTSLKFGIYKPRVFDDIEDKRGVRSKDGYVWRLVYGDSPNVAFEKIRSEIIKVAEAAQKGDLSSIESISLPHMFKWKIAFLYQNRKTPVILPIFSKDLLNGTLENGEQFSQKELYEKLLEHRGETSIFQFTDELLNDYSDDTDGSQKTVESTQDHPLNQILYGPPGTGKTYATIDEALKILDPDFFDEFNEDRTKLKKRFDALMEDKQVRFVTFHQSFSYEDFVEGLRASTKEESGQLSYYVEDGIFKRICIDAVRKRKTEQKLQINTNPRVWKISIDGTDESSLTRKYCFANNQARIGWGHVGDLKQANLQDPIHNLGSNDQSTLYVFGQEIQVGDVLLCLRSAWEISAVGIVASDYYYENTPPAGVIDNYQHVRNVNWIFKDLKFNVLSLNGGVRLTLKAVYELWRIKWPELITALEKDGITLPKQMIENEDDSQPHVLIIDEINRGNISRIFGELITLIEPSKRAGKDEALQVILPYSKKQFSVPNNVYIIGTMNTADRSLAGLDIALRRRFSFIEMPPKPELLKEVIVEGVDIEKLLTVMNQRIEALLDRDHCLGHAYFLELKDNGSIEKLAFIFKQKILPLLQEYFFEDWERICWVLNDHRKSITDHCFLIKSNSEADIKSLFGEKVAPNIQDRCWQLNKDAFSKKESYLGIIEGDKQ